MSDATGILDPSREGRLPGSLNVCLILSGSIAAYKACELASSLVKAGHRVQTLATEAALRFVGRASLEGLTDRPVYTELWAPRENMAHISLRAWADVFVFYPATANRINALAAGLAPDLLGAVFLANNFEKPFWICPAMNSGMFAHPATREALKKLASWGCRIIEGGEGRLACGDLGPGRLAEPEDVFALLREESSRAARERSGPSRKRLLLTGGAMTEPVDAVRSIMNGSTGRTASAIARAFLDSGWEVDYLHHEGADRSGSEGARLRPYRGFGDFRASIESLLAANEYDMIVHAAAVSDYRVAAAEGPGATGGGGAKLESGKPLTLRLEPNPKILPSLRSLARGKPLIAAFKLTSGADEEEGERRAAAMIGAGEADAVAWNDTSGLSGGGHAFTLFASSGARGAAPEMKARGGTNAELAEALLDLAMERIPHE